MERKTQQTSAAMAGMSIRSAQKWQCGPLPSETGQERWWRTRTDPFDGVWEEETLPLLQGEAAGRLRATTIIEWLEERCPGRFSASQLRTLQRRLQDWRALNGPDQEVYFPQEHPPGREAQIDFTHCNSLGVTIGGRAYRHLLFQLVLSHSGWRYAEVVAGETFLALKQGLQKALWALGGAPLVIRSDNTSALTHEIKRSRGRAMDELGIQMIFALSPQAKGRVERAAGTFQDRLVTELRLAGASSIREANGVLEQFLPRYNRRFRVPPQCSESAYRPLGSDLSLEQVLCFKHRREVARDNTVKFQLHTLQLLPELERPSYAGAVVEVLEGLDGRLRVHHEGRIINAQEASPSPAFLRNGHGDSATPLASPSGVNHLDQRWATTLKSLDSRSADEEDQAGMTGGASTALTPATAPPRKPTFLQKERWKAIQKAMRKGMSLRAIERELGIHRATIKKYMDAAGPPGRRSRPVLTAPTSDTVAP